MGTLSRVMISAAVLALAVGASPAAAATPFNVGQGVDPRVAVGPRRSRARRLEHSVTRRHAGEGRLLPYPSRRQRPATLKRELGYPVAGPPGPARGGNRDRVRPDSDEDRRARRVFPVRRRQPAMEQDHTLDIDRRGYVRSGRRRSWARRRRSAFGIGPNGTWLDDREGLFVTPAGGNTALVTAPVADRSCRRRRFRVYAEHRAGARHHEARLCRQQPRSRPVRRPHRTGVVTAASIGSLRELDHQRRPERARGKQHRNAAQLRTQRRVCLPDLSARRPQRQPRLAAPFRRGYEHVRRRVRAPGPARRSTAAPTTPTPR